MWSVGLDGTISVVSWHGKMHRCAFLAGKVHGYDFNIGIDHHQLLKSFKYSGFQATNFGLAVEEIWKMIRCREEPIPEDKREISQLNGVKNNCTIFLGYTSNMASCGVRETIRFLVQHKVRKELMMKKCQEVFLTDDRLYCSFCWRN